jgi:hypothetical protein
MSLFVVGSSVRLFRRIPLTLTGTGTLTGGSATTSAGVATYSNLKVSAAGIGRHVDGDLVAESESLHSTLAYGSQQLVRCSVRGDGIATNRPKPS